MPPGRLAALARDYPDWQIKRVSLHPTWVAEFRSGTVVRVVASHDLDLLRGKLANADEQIYGSIVRRSASHGR